MFRYRIIFFTTLVLGGITTIAQEVPSIPENPEIPEHIQRMDRETLMHICTRLQIGYEQCNRYLQDVVRPAIEEAERQRGRDRKKIQELQAQLKKEKEDGNRERGALLDEVEKLDLQLRNARSIEGWLYHKKGALVWLGIACIIAAAKKGAFKWTDRYRRQLKRALKTKARSWQLKGTMLQSYLMRRKKRIVKRIKVCSKKGVRNESKINSSYAACNRE